jgi:cysteine desulfurase
VEAIVLTINRLIPTEKAKPVIFATNEQVRLTKYTHGLGCACKLRPQALEKILASLPRPTDANVLVGAESSDDAAVYRLSDTLAIVQTVDFFTPIVDDPYHFGAIAAANSLSDIYAMGGKPLFALSIVGFPSNRLPMSVLQRILQGAADKAAQAGISIIGGHTVDDTEPKYGLAVSGIVDPNRILRNNTARVGDKLILTKPIGTGIISTAIKRQMADEALTQKVIGIMSRLNDIAAQTMLRYDVSSVTDVTGFGLLGHLKEMTVGSGVNAHINSQAVPFISEAVGFASSGTIPGGTENNLDYVAAFVRWDDSISRVLKYVLCDAQTSGGLLIAVAASESKKLLADLRAVGIVDASIIGEITEIGDGVIAIA